MTNAAHGIETDRVAKLVPGGAPALARLSDDDLLANTRRLVGKSNQLLAALLVHLAEVETRGAHRTRRCASLYTYCIYELRFSEDAAARRSAAARFIKQFPALLDAIANGELHLTGLLMIGPHLTFDNHLEVLGRAKFRTKKELGKLIRDLNPLPGLPDCVQPLGPEPPRALRTPTWAEYVESLSPDVRELLPGERPRDWVNDNIQDFAFTNAGVDDQATHDEALPVGPLPANLPPVAKPQQYQVQFCSTEERAQLIDRAKDLLSRERPMITLGELHLEAMKLLVASLEKRKFAVGAKPRGSAPSGPPHQSKAPAVDGSRPQPDTHELPRQRGTERPPRQRGPEQPPRQRDTERPPRQRGSERPPRPHVNGDTSPQHAVGEPSHGCDPHRASLPLDTEQTTHQRVADPMMQRHDAEKTRRREHIRNSSRQRDTERPPRQRDTERPPRQRDTERPPRQRGNGELPPQHDVGDGGPERPSRGPSTRRSRHVPAAQQREVYGRDSGRCSYVDARGDRCRETRYLEIHHLKPFARGGTHEVSNLALRCRAHNDLAAEEDFGREIIAERRDSARQDSLARQLRTPRG